MKENAKEMGAENARDMGLLLLLGGGIIYSRYGGWVQAKMQEPYFLVMLGVAVSLLLGVVWFIGHYIEKLQNRFTMWRLGIEPPKKLAWTFCSPDLQKQLKKFYKDGKNKDVTFLGMNAEKGNNHIVTIPDIQRCQHMQILGMTGTGKTEGVFLPLIFQDASKGRAVIIIDAKGELSTINKLNAMLHSIGRSKDLLLFSLSHKGISCTYNPLHVGECDPQIVIDSVLSNYKDSNTFYWEMSKTIFTHVFYIFHSLGKPFTIMDVYTYLTKPACFASINNRIKPDNKIGKMNLDMLQGLIARLTTQYGGWENMVTGFNNYLLAHQDANLNDPDSDIVLTDAIRQGKIIYFQLPINAYPILAVSIARMIQANLRYISSLIQTGQLPRNTLVSVIVDEYGAFAEASFVSVFNQARSSGMMITVSHQSLSDLEAVSPTFMKLVDQGTLNKIYLKIDGHEDCEKISKNLGTFTKEEKTYRMTKGKFGNQIYTGDSSSKMVNEFNFPPDKIKNLHPYGQGYFIYRGDNSQKCVNLGRFTDITELPYERKEKKNKREGAGAFKEYYLNPKPPQKEPGEKENSGENPHLGDPKKDE